MAENQLLFVPLGGAGEIGMNLNLYGFGPAGAEQWIMVDLGITFGDGTMPGVDVMTPDPAFIVERRDQLLGIVLTHAHEDHLGAVAYLWERLRCPVYATAFTISILKRKLTEADLLDAVKIIEVPLSGRVKIGPFDLEFITLTHSIPEPNAIAITTPLGTVMHTGDWKLDPGPVVGPGTDVAALKRVGDAGVLAIVCDSTNAMTPGTSGSEADLLGTLTALIAARQGRVAVASFASNVARLETIAKAAAAAGRDVVLAGRSLWRINAAARENGYLADVAAFVSEEDAGFMPRDRVVIICTGSQGEPRAALARIAAGEHPHVVMEPGDSVIFSSRIIPGNEVSISHLHNDLARRGLEIITAKDHPVHVSGHPARDELVQMYQYIRPEIAVPVHGERRHLEAHALLARDCQVPHTVVAENGAVVRLDGAAPGVRGQVQAGRLAVVGNRMVALNGTVVRGRARAMYNGVAFVTITLDGGGRLARPPELTAIGVLDDGEEEVQTAVVDAVVRAVGDLRARARLTDDAIAEAARIAARRAFRHRLAVRPHTVVHVVRLEDKRG